MGIEVKRTGWKKKWKKPKLAEAAVPESKLHEVEEDKKRNKSPGQKRGDREKGSRGEVSAVDQYSIEAYQSDEADKEKKKSKLLRKKKRKGDETRKSEIGKGCELYNSVEDGPGEQNGAVTQGIEKDGKSGKKRRRSDKTKKAGNEVEDGSKDDNGKSRKAHTSKKELQSSRKEDKSLEKREPEQDEVYEISSGDEDCSRGMKKWITEYHQSRPGLKILQQRIDDFMTAFEAQEEQARKEKAALAAEGGWTVVEQRKGRKKTTDPETGIAVGSVAEAAVLEKRAKKKSKEVGLDFYRFQKREAHRNEVMALQSKFEQDKKRIQQLRAARKFRPY